MLDGGVEGGYFHDPYCNDSNFRGFPLTSQENLEAILEQASGLAWRVGIHVVGDAAMVMALDAFEATDARLSNGVRGHGPWNTPFRQCLVPWSGPGTPGLELPCNTPWSTVWRATCEPTGAKVERRTSDCTPSRAWLDSGAVIGAGTDSPVASHDPWLNVYGFATRDTKSAGIQGPQHRISIAEALRCYTVGSAAILGQDKFLGSLEVGKAADFICLDRDPLSASPEEVRAMVVRSTIVGGRRVFAAGD